MNSGLPGKIAATIKIALLVTIYSTTLPVQAQSGPALQEKQQQTQKRQLEEVIVTAQKREQSTLEVPVSVSAISGDNMRDIGATGIQDVVAYIPNLKFSADTDPILATVSIRGLGSNPLNTTFESSVGFVQDEVFYARPSYYSEMVFDIERLEVLRGPQGTLFGKNTVAGVFNVTSKTPGDELSTDIRLSAAGYGEERLEAGVTIPIADSFSSRISILSFKRDGELENTDIGGNYDDIDQLAGRVQFLVTPSDELKVLLSYVKSDQESNYWPQQLVSFEQHTADYLSQFDPEVEDDPFNQQLSQNTDGYVAKGSESFTLKTDYDIGHLIGLDDLTVTLVLGSSSLYINSVVDLDISPADITDLAVFSDSGQKSAELRFSGSTDKGLFGLGETVEYVAGLYYIDSRFEQIADLITGEDLASYLATPDFRQLAGQDANDTGALPDQFGAAAALAAGSIIGEDSYRLALDLESQAMALFGQFNWTINERWAVTPGIRFNQETKTVDLLGESTCNTKETTGCVLSTLLSAEEYNFTNLERTETDVSPKLSVQYFIDDSVNIFGTIAKGFKGGGFNGSSLTGQNLEYDAEQADTIELGMKGKIFDNTLLFSATLFQTKFDNLQVLIDTGTGVDVQNAAAATAEGVEADFRWLTPLEFLSVSGSLGYLNARYDEYDAAPTPVGSEEETQDLAGKRLANAQNSSLQISPEITLPLFGNVSLKVGIDLLYYGSQFSEIDLDDEVKFDPYTTYNGRVSVGDLDAGWLVSLGGTNLTDKDSLSRKSDTIFFPHTYHATQRPSRKVFLAVSYNW
ncbi:TonB-dependent receptor [Spongiibacter sp. KMU-166]|uniref:TonB-dependent receptor n=1 Tax=Spongiibacter thalassae TaxID=2721624 RepID=A0ABX1GAD8_9GAMM|nr:TonB-dependent receptor [Spongiibacter thalassae]NKI15915.1 TonB-dependent receptor [Spongiibacter thalassae]